MIIIVREVVDNLQDVILVSSTYNRILPSLETYIISCIDIIMKWYSV